MRTIAIGLKYEVLHGRTIKSFWLEPLLFDKGHFCCQRILAFRLSVTMAGGCLALFRPDETAISKADVGIYVGAISETP
jgi:hypothetical protein